MNVPGRFKAAALALATTALSACGTLRNEVGYAASVHLYRQRSGAKCKVEGPDKKPIDDITNCLKTNTACVIERDSPHTVRAIGQEIKEGETCQIPVTVRNGEGGYGAFCAQHNENATTPPYMFYKATKLVKKQTNNGETYYDDVQSGEHKGNFMPKKKHKGCN